MTDRVDSNGDEGLSQHKIWIRCEGRGELLAPTSPRKACLGTFRGLIGFAHPKDMNTEPRSGRSTSVFLDIRMWGPRSSSEEWTVGSTDLQSYHVLSCLTGGK